MHVELAHALSRGPQRWARPRAGSGYTRSPEPGSGRRFHRPERGAIAVFITVPAVVAPGLVGTPDAEATTRHAVVDLFHRFLQTTVHNRVKASVHGANPHWGRLPEGLSVSLAADRLTLHLADAEPDDVDAQETLRWLLLAWALCWMAHSHETAFARPVQGFDLTVALDPVAVAQEHAGGPNGACRLGAYVLPRAVKWGAKRRGLSELYRRIGAGEQVLFGAVRPLLQSGAVKASGWPAPKKADAITADEARRWLSLNPRRAF